MASEEAIRQFRTKLGKIRKAIKYIDGCGEFTFEKMVKANDIAEGDMTRSQLHDMWDQAVGHPEGPEHVRREIRAAYKGSIDDLTGIAEQMGIDSSQITGTGCVVLLAAGLLAAGCVVAAFMVL